MLFSAALLPCRKGIRLCGGDNVCGRPLDPFARTPMFLDFYRSSSRIFPGVV